MISHNTSLIGCNVGSRAVVTVSSMTLYVLMPLYVTVLSLTLIIVMTLGSDLQLAGTLTVDVVHRSLLTDEIGAALGVTLTHLTVIDARHTDTGLHTVSHQHTGCQTQQMQRIHCSSLHSSHCCCMDT